MQVVTNELDVNVEVFGEAECRRRILELVARERNAPKKNQAWLDHMRFSMARIAHETIRFDVSVARTQQAA